MSASSKYALIAISPVDLDVLHFKGFDDEPDCLAYRDFHRDCKREIEQGTEFFICPASEDIIKAYWEGFNAYIEAHLDESDRKPIFIPRYSLNRRKLPQYRR